MPETQTDNAHVLRATMHDMRRKLFGHKDFPINPHDSGSNEWELFEHLRINRWITTKAIHSLGCGTNRIREFRLILKSHGMDLRCCTIPGDKSNRLYEVVGGMI